MKAVPFFKLTQEGADTIVNAAIDKAKEKLTRKGCDWMLLNDVGNGKVFGEDQNTITLLKRDGQKGGWHKLVYKLA